MMSLVSHVGPYEASLRAKYDAARASLSAPRSIPATTRIVRPYQEVLRAKAQAAKEAARRAEEARLFEEDRLRLAQEVANREDPIFVAKPWKDIVRETCEKHKVGVGQVMSDQRYASVVAARNEVFYRMSRECVLSLPRIGQLLGKDHTTVLHGIRRYMQKHGLEA